MNLQIPAGTGAQPRQKATVKGLENLILELPEEGTEAFEKLYSLTKSAVYGIALSILKKPQDAEDIMQETYIRIYRSSPEYQPKGKPMAWILRIARNLSYDRLRLKGESELTVEDEWLPAEKHDFTESSIDRLLLGNVLEKISETDRQIVIMHSVAGLKHREIADLVGIPLATTLSKYHRTLSKLRRMLEEEKVERN